LIDLHTHSQESDGTDSPAALVERAAAAGLEALAITDHDTLSGVAEASAAAAQVGLPFVAGVELSTRRADEPDPASRSVHLLGYFFEPPRDGFCAWLESLKQCRRDRNVRMAERLRELGYDVHVEEAEALGHGITGRPHFARLLVDKGYFKTYEQAFRELLGETRPAYVERLDPSPEEGIGRLRNAGALVSLAHAARINKRGGEEERIIQGMVDAGLQALEVWHSDHGERERSRYAQLADKYNLALTGGSDYHGAHKPDILLGRGRRTDQRVPLSVLDNLRSRAGH
jgi:predicted metal-dependent phosphoesterase TrpH